MVVVSDRYLNDVTEVEVWLVERGFLHVDDRQGNEEGKVGGQVLGPQHLQPHKETSLHRGRKLICSELYTTHTAPNEFNIFYMYTLYNVAAIKICRRYASPRSSTHLPEVGNVLVGELSLEVDQQPAEAAVEVVGVLLLCQVTGRETAQVIHTEINNL